MCCRSLLGLTADLAPCFHLPGWGNLSNTIVILSLLAMFNQYGPTYK